MVKFLPLFISLILASTLPSFAQFKSVTDLEAIEISVNTGEKPQSKVWAHDSKFWTVLPDNTGTYVWRLDGTKWTRTLKISDKTTSKVDCKVVGNTTHVLLFHESPNREADAFFDLVTLKYENNVYSHQIKTSNFSLNKDIETATIDIDSKGRMWLSYTRSKAVRVRWSDSPYSNWSSEIKLAEDLKNDDISVVIALPGKIGVFWSNQNTTKFGFRVHEDGDSPHNWSELEEVVHHTDGDIRGGLADDHMNMAVASDGTLYCAIKTSYYSGDQPLLGLFVRRPNGIWDNLYSVSKEGSRTRPIVVLNEVEKLLRVIYTDNESGGNIVYKETSTDYINFEGYEQALNEAGEQTMSKEHLLIRGFYNNVTSIKGNFTDEIVIMASTSDNASGQRYAVSVLATSEIIPLPVELVSFKARLATDNAVLEWKTASEQDNDYFSVEASLDGRTFTTIGRVAGNGTTQLQHHYTFTDQNIAKYRADGVYYRLRQVDYSGKFEYSPTRYVSAPAIPDGITLKAFPSPFNDYLQVQINSNKSQDATMTLYNAQGSIIMMQQPKLHIGLNHIMLSGLDLAAGIYYLKVTTANQQQVSRVVSE